MDIKIIEELNAYALPLWRKLPFKVLFDHKEIVLDSMLDFPDYTIDEYKKDILKRMGLEMKEEKRFGNSKELIKEQSRRGGRDTFERRTNDEAYRLKNNSDKNKSAKRIRTANGKPYENIKLAKRIAAAVHKALRISLKAFKCTLPLGRCFRKSQKTQYKVGTVCPLMGKYCIRDGKCSPLNGDAGSLK